MEMCTFSSGVAIRSSPVISIFQGDTVKKFLTVVVILILVGLAVASAGVGGEVEKGDPIAPRSCQAERMDDVSNSLEPSTGTSMYSWQAKYISQDGILYEASGTKLVSIHSPELCPPTYDPYAAEAAGEGD